jgi:hypothetical protein
MYKYLLSILLPLNTFAQIAITNGLTHELKSTPNGKVTGRIKLINLGKEPETFNASKYNIIFECGSYGSFSDLKTNDRSLNDWLEFDVDEKTLSPNEAYDLVYRINIPDNAATGTYWNAVMVEKGEPIVGKGSGVGVQNKSRYAVQIILNVGSFEDPKLTYKNVTLIKNENKTKTLKVELENSGFFAVPVKVQLELYNDKGAKIKVLNALTKRIYPSRCNIYDIEVKDLASGKYDGVVMSYSGKKIYGSNISISIE